MKEFQLKKKIKGVVPSNSRLCLDSGWRHCRKYGDAWACLIVSQESEWERVRASESEGERVSPWPQGQHQPWATPWLKLDSWSGVSSDSLASLLRLCRKPPRKSPCKSLATLLANLFPNLFRLSRNPPCKSLPNPFQLFRNPPCKSLPKPLPTLSQPSLQPSLQVSTGLLILDRVS